MINIVMLLITIAVGAAGGLIARRLKMPAGAMTGALIAVAIYTLITEKGYFPSGYKMYIQFFTGALVGTRLTKKDIMELPSLALPAVVQFLSMLVLNLVFGLLMHYMGGLDITTAFFSSAPAGMTDMALIAADYGANTLYVSIIQMMRIVIIVTCMPAFYKAIIRRRDPAQLENKGKGRGTKEEAKNTSSLPNSVRLLITVAVAFAGGFLFRFLGIKSGAMIGAIVGTGLLSVFTDLAYFPSKYKIGTQICAGAFVGAQLSKQSLYLLPKLILPVVIMLMGMFIFVYCFGMIMQKVSGLDLMTSLLMSTPGGMQEMTLMAQDFDCDTPKVVMMHIVRIMVVIFTFPPLIGFLQTVLS